MTMRSLTQPRRVHPPAEIRLTPIAEQYHQGPRNLCQRNREHKHSDLHTLELVIGKTARGLREYCDPEGKVGPGLINRK